MQQALHTLARRARLKAPPELSAHAAEKPVYIFRRARAACWVGARSMGNALGTPNVPRGTQIQVAVVGSKGVGADREPLMSAAMRPLLGPD